MDASSILMLFVASLLAQRVVEFLLLALNYTHVKRHSGSVPLVFENTVDSKTAERAALYALDRMRLDTIELAYDTIVTLVIVFSGAIGWLDLWTASVFSHNIWFVPASYVHGVAFILTAMISMYLLGVPFELYSTFRIEERYQFNTMTFKLWLLDQLKGLIVGAVILTIVLLLLFWVMDAVGANWWIWASVMLIGISLLMSVLFPILIMPLFNRFVPLEEGELTVAIGKLCERLKYPLRGVFQMDGSKRSKHANAFFVGFGKTKRVVLFDTLLSTLTKDQILAVLAHEIGHKKHGHIIKGFVISAIAMVLGLWILSLLLNYDPLFHAFGVNIMSYHTALVIFSIVTSPVTYFLTPFSSLFSRRNEYQADRFAVLAIGQRQPMAEGLVTLAKDNLSNLWPHPIYSGFYYSHPTVPERISAIEKVALPG